MTTKTTKLALAGSILVLSAGIGPFSALSIAEDTRALLRKPVTTEKLSRQRGGSDFKTVINLNDVRGSVDNNAATNVVTGHNTISASFAGAAGMPMVIQNTGNNVLIQNATIVNVQIQ